MSSQRFNYFLLALLALAWIYMIYEVSNQDDKQMDFKTYYYAAKVASLGQNPYDLANLNNVSQTKITLPYVYPPLTIWFFRPLTIFSYEMAYQIWLYFKVALLALLLFIWRSSFLKEKGDAAFYLFCTIAYAGPIYWDLVAGNICILEQFLVWTGLYFLTRKQLLLFTICIILVSLFKITFIVFLLLPSLLYGKSSLKFLLTGSVAFAGVMLAGYLAETSYFANYLSLALAIDERGVMFNPSLLSFFRDVSDLYLPAVGITATPSLLPTSIYLLAVVLIIYFSVKVVQGANNQKSKLSPLDLIYFFCLVYALVMPRFKTYSYILLLPGTYYVMRERAKKVEPFLLMFILLSLTKWTPLPFTDLPKFLWWYYSLFLALLIWIVFLLDIKRSSRAV